MTPIKNLYVIRLILALIAGAIGSALPTFTGTSNALINSITVALLVYLASYYAIKAKYKNLIEKQSQILTTGIGAYFFTWLTFLILFYTLSKTIAF